MKFQYNDGGRKAAGYKGKAGDCACRAVAIATQRPYGEIHALINQFAKLERTSKRKRGKSDADKGVFPKTLRRVMDALGWKWNATMGIGTGCRVHLRDGEIPHGRIVADVSRHYTAIIDGVINDTYDPSRGETRCVYGYYTPTERAIKPTDAPIVEPDAPRRAQRTRYDERGFLVFTKAQMRRALESLIPSELREYYIGCEIDVEFGGLPLTADNSEIYAYFKRPVICNLSDARYVHCRLADFADEIDGCFVGDGLPTDDEEMYADYDETYGDRPVIEIKGDPIEKNAERRALVESWKKGKRRRVG